MSRKILLNIIKNTVETLPLDEAFLLDLKETVSKLNPVKRPSTSYKPSSLNCMRKMYFDKIQAPIDAKINEYNGVRIGETGTMSHEAIQSYVVRMKSCGKDCEFIDVEQYVKEHNLTYLEIRSHKTYETHLYDTRYGISFLCDGIIKYKGQYFILEIKTETDDKGLSRDSADAYHRLQSVSYSLSLGINKIMWLYEERNFCTPKTFITTVTDEEKLALVLRFETVDNAVKELKPPERATNRKPCQYCLYVTECKKYNRT